MAGALRAADERVGVACKSLKDVGPNHEIWRLRGRWHTIRHDVFAALRRGAFRRVAVAGSVLLLLLAAGVLAPLLARPATGPGDSRRPSLSGVPESIQPAHHGSF